MAIGGPERNGEVFSQERRRLQEQLVNAIDGPLRPLDHRVRTAFLGVPRDRHLPPSVSLADAYSDKIVPLDREECLREIKAELARCGVRAMTEQKTQGVIDILLKDRVSTASMPSLVAHMTQAVLPDAGVSIEGKRALDLGTGMGFQAAILRAVGYEVVTVEIKRRLIDVTREIFKKACIGGIELVCGDGKLGYPNCAPYDAIVVAAAVGDDAVVSTLMSQLSRDGKLVAPFRLKSTRCTLKLPGDVAFDFWMGEQELRLYCPNPNGEGYAWERLFDVQFVDLK